MDHLEWWKTEDSHVLLNPRMSDDQKHLTQTLLTKVSLPGHVWMATSGSSASHWTEQKWAALSKQALLISAEAVNAHLESHADDIWLHGLPDFHVGGVGIWARSALSGASVVDVKKISGDKWNCFTFQEEGHRVEATLTSLVPAQLYDLVHHQLQAPASLRASIIGGGALNAELYQQAKKLGWNPLPSYGMTECCSQVATASLESLKKEEMPLLKILPHVELSLASDHTLRIVSDSLLTIYAFVNEEGLRLVAGKNEGVFQTEDVAEIQGGHLVVHGRGSDFVKIGGESVDMQRLNLLIDQICCRHQLKADMALVAVPDPRLGYVIHLAVAMDAVPEETLSRLVDHYHRETLPFERIRQVISVPSIPRTALGKIKRIDLLELTQKKTERTKDLLLVRCERR